MSALHAVDLDSDQLRDLFVDALRTSDPASRQLGYVRAERLVVALYEAIRRNCEDLEPLLHEMRLNTAHLQREVARSEMRRFGLEVRLGIADVIPGEVVDDTQTTGAPASVTAASTS